MGAAMPHLTKKKEEIMNKLSDNLKIDVAVPSMSRTSGNTTGAYYRMDNFRKSLFVFDVGAMALTNTVIGQVYQATDAAAGSEKVITKATATIAANTKVKAAKITLATFTNASVVVINGITFTGHTNTTTLASREFSVSGDDTADAVELCKCINDATYGVSGVLASSALGVVTLTATEPGDNYLTVVGVTTIGVAATLRADAFIEIDASDLDTANGFDHVALNIATNATLLVGGTLLRGDERYSPTQYVAASESA